MYVFLSTIHYPGEFLGWKNRGGVLVLGGWVSRAKRQLINYPKGVYTPLPLYIHIHEMADGCFINEDAWLKRDTHVSFLAPARALQSVCRAPLLLINSTERQSKQKRINYKAQARFHRHFAGWVLQLNYTRAGTLFGWESDSLCRVAFCIKSARAVIIPCPSARLKLQSLTHSSTLASFFIAFHTNNHTLAYVLFINPISIFKAIYLKTF